MGGDVEGAMDGLASRLETIQGLRVLTHPPVSVGELPAVVLLFESREPALTLAGGAFAGSIKAVVLAGPADAAAAFEALGGFMSSEGAGSVEAAVEADSTWDGSVDYGRLVSAGNVGRRKLWGGLYAAADFQFEFTKSA